MYHTVQYEALPRIVRILFFVLSVIKVFRFILVPSAITALLAAEHGLHLALNLVVILPCLLGFLLVICGIKSHMNLMCSRLSDMV